MDDAKQTEIARLELEFEKLEKDTEIARLKLEFEKLEKDTEIARLKLEFEKLEKDLSKKNENEEIIEEKSLPYDTLHPRWNDDVNAMQGVIDMKNNIRLLIRLPQSGKTQIMLNELTDFVETYNNSLAIVVCDNSLLLTTQTRGRAGNQQSVKIGSISSNANGYCQWKQVVSLDNPKAEKCGDNPKKNEVKIVAEINQKKKESLEKRVKKNDINTIVMCSNKTRWNDIAELIDMFKSTHKIVIWIDEADKTVGGIDSNTGASKDKIKLLKNWSNIVESINLITATPFTPKRNWSNLSWIGNHFGDIMELVKIPEIVGDNYHHLYNSHYYKQEKESGESSREYAERYLDKYPASPGDIFLIPGNREKASHNEIQKMCLDDSRFDYVIILNSETKSINNNIGVVIEYKEINEKTKVEETKNIKKQIKIEEVSSWLSKWYKASNINTKRVALTGNICLSRGITISSPICQITHMIFSSSSNICEDEQLLSRVCGYCYTLVKPLVVCEENVWDNVTKYQKAIIKLSEIAICDNHKDRILSIKKLNSIIHDIDENKRRPYMFEGFDMDKYGSLFNNNNKIKDYKKNMVMEIIKENNTSLYEFINNSKCKQITTPVEEASYKKHIIDVYKKYQENKNFVIDFTPEEKKNDSWMGIIDNKNNRLFIIVWVVNSIVI